MAFAVSKGAASVEDSTRDPILGLDIQDGVSAVALQYPSCRTGSAFA